MISCIAINDQPGVLEPIKAFISQSPFFQLTGAFENIRDALKLLSESHVDVIFLNIASANLGEIQSVEAAKGTGLIVLTNLHRQKEQPWVKGGILNQLSALNTTLGPVKKIKGAEKPCALGIKDDFIFVKSEHNILKISLDDIFYIEGYKDYLKIYTHSPKPVYTLKSMKSLEEVLEGKGFIRIHRSYIISIDKISLIRRGKVKVKEKFMPIGEIYKQKFEDMVLTGRI